MNIQKIDLICQQFFNISVKPKRNLNFEHEWKQRDLSDPYYFSLAYFCVGAVLDDERTRNNSSYLQEAVSVLNYIEQNDRDYQNGSVFPWSRLGDAFRSLGEHKKAIQAYNRGIETLTQTFNWKIGELLPIEARMGIQYSNIELLYARRGRSDLELSRFDDACHIFDTVLSSLQKRGIQDLVNTHFPEGIMTLLKSAQAGKSIVVDRTPLSDEENQYQRQGTSLARMFSRFLGK
ncbi:MAG: tetratricopeptide repeat protein [Balneola sp.]|nr:tetratricopeptide repeat protein [Balneola sp.]MBO6651442.1 tetratricopeptide repeat protein [Balneola sp.]MBO6712521.1 tetratricopeptide repeat protein [Balneola sp.]MBO6800986.1 tetratricopeptide repeat protein [Balneola sp.]MBO6870658.1 tetratricopeptide repeat protein [Balneola sp.]